MRMLALAVMKNAEVLVNVDMSVIPVQGGLHEPVGQDNWDNLPAVDEGDAPLLLLQERWYLVRDYCLHLFISPSTLCQHNIASI